MKSGIYKKQSRSGTASTSRRLGVVKSLGPYLAAAGKCNLLEGSIGKQQLSKEVKPLVDAIHKVLAGATVSSIKVTGPYEKSVAQKLDALLRTAIAETNRRNAAKGARVMYI
ncbi:MAG: hypothetical protein JW768_16075 [Chitinispirillaceae bacterium]|nr:hypothetical protein [Chitinispirillaceae bacterium]